MTHPCLLSKNILCLGKKNPKGLCFLKPSSGGKRSTAELSAGTKQKRKRNEECRHVPKRESFSLTTYQKFKKVSVSTYTKSAFEELQSLFSREVLKRQRKLPIELRKFFTRSYYQQKTLRSTWVFWIQLTALRDNSKSQAFAWCLYNWSWCRHRSHRLVSFKKAFSARSFSVSCKTEKW